MKFLDKKEQVLELQVTQYGKSLMSRGQFQPTHYAFFDNDVVYDSQYMSGSGPTHEYSSPLVNSTSESSRITSAIRPEVQYSYSGIETNFNKIRVVDNIDQLLVGSGEKTLTEQLELLAKPSDAIDNYYSLGLPMGTSEYNSSKAPAWKIELHSGEITEEVTFYTGSSGLIKIPQLEVEAFYDTYIKGPETSQQENLDTNENVIISQLEDGSYIKVEKEHILVDFGELNSLFENENFEVEVYEIIENLAYTGITFGVQEHLEPLYFMKNHEVSDSLHDSSLGNNTQPETQLNVEYYFDVMVDEEITEKPISSPINIYDTPPNDKEPC